jgi:hypothetical protein
LGAKKKLARFWESSFGTSVSGLGQELKEGDKIRRINRRITLGAPEMKGRNRAEAFLV